MSRNILVTGANGQLGNEMRRLGASSPNNYIYTDVAELDITNVEAIRHFVSKQPIDVIINCAAYTNVDKAEDDEAMAELINTTATNNLALVAKGCGATLIHVSTDYVFKGDGCIPYREEMPTEPQGVYGVTKRNGEIAIESSGCDHMIIRTAWLYSEFGNNFVKTMQRLTAERDSLNVVFDQVGSPTYAADLAATIFEIVESGRHKGASGIYHYSNEGVCSWFDFAREIAELSGNSCQIKPCHSDEFPSRVKRPHFSVLDKSKIKAQFSIEIPHWTESLRRAISRMKLQ